MSKKKKIKKAKKLLRKNGYNVSKQSDPFLNYGVSPNIAEGIGKPITIHDIEIATATMARQTIQSPAWKKLEESFSRLPDIFEDASNRAAQFIQSFNSQQPILSGINFELGIKPPVSPFVSDFGVLKNPFRNLYEIPARVEILRRVYGKHNEKLQRLYRALNHIVNNYNSSVLYSDQIDQRLKILPHIVAKQTEFIAEAEIVKADWLKPGGGFERASKNCGGEKVRFSPPPTLLSEFFFSNPDQQ